MEIKKALELLGSVGPRTEQIANYYGIENQMSMLEEECAELIQAVSKLRRAGVSEKQGLKYIDARGHVTEEMADVLNLLIQMTHLLENGEMLLFWLDQKLNRTIQRIEKEAQNETA